VPLFLWGAFEKAALFGALPQTPPENF